MANSQVPTSQTFATQSPKTIEAAEKQFTKPIAFDKPPVVAVGTVAATGSDETDAAPLPLAPYVLVTAADGTKGVILPAAGIGTTIEVYAPANTLKVYPPAGCDINGGTDNAALSIKAKTPARFTNVDGETWSAFYTAP